MYSNFERRFVHKTSKRRIDTHREWRGGSLWSMTEEVSGADELMAAVRAKGYYTDSGTVLCCVGQTSTSIISCRQICSSA